MCVTFPQAVACSPSVILCLFALSVHSAMLCSQSMFIWYPHVRVRIQSRISRIKAFSFSLNNKPLGSSRNEVGGDCRVTWATWRCFMMHFRSPGLRACARTCFSCLSTRQLKAAQCIRTQIIILESLGRVFSVT